MNVELKLLYSLDQCTKPCHPSRWYEIVQINTIVTWHWSVFIQRLTCVHNSEKMLESYVTPLLMSYVNKYIKNLKPSDLQLSLWGGDVVLSKLDLKLDVLEQVMCADYNLCFSVHWSRYTPYVPKMLNFDIWDTIRGAAFCCMHI